MYVDTHTHLYDEAFAEDFDLVVERAVNAGVTRLVFPDESAAYRPKMLECAARYPEVIAPCVGFHPEEATPEKYKAELDELHKALETEAGRFVALGETGLDYHWEGFDKEIQKECFREHLRLCQKLDLPVIIHQRDALEDTFAVLSEFKGIRGVFHAFTESYETFKRLDRYGDFYVGIGGVCTFKNAHIGRDLAKIPLDRILLETDSPYLTPVPHRGTRNESAYIPIIAQFIAGAKGITAAEVADQTTRSAINLFKL